MAKRTLIREVYYMIGWLAVSLAGHDKKKIYIIIEEKLLECVLMCRKKRLIRCLQRFTCDKYELNKFALKIRKRLSEACADLGDCKKR